MSEYEPLPPIEIEDDAVAVIKINESLELTSTRHNTLLRTYKGLARSAFNNILVTNEQAAMLLYKEAADYPQLLQFIMDNDFPMLLNQTEVPVDVQETYYQTVAQATPDTMPEDWA